MLVMSYISIAKIIRLRYLIDWLFSMLISIRLGENGQRLYRQCQQPADNLKIS